MHRTALQRRFSTFYPASACLLFAALGACFDPPPPRSTAARTEAETDATTGGDEPGGDASSSTGIGPDGEGDDESSGGRDSSSGSTGGDAETPVPCGGGDGICAAVPLGWNGPVGLDVASVEAGAGCGGVAEVFRARGDIDIPDATCGCECAPAVGAECSGAVLTAWAGDDTCSETEVFVQNLSPAGDSCNFMPAIDATGTLPLSEASFWTLATESSGGACRPQADVDIPSAQFTSEVVGCDVAPVEGICAGDEVCVDASSPGAVCIWREGDHACPGDGFTERTVYFGGDLVDQRACTTCSCGNAEGACPSSEATLHVGYYCNGDGVSIQTDCTQACVGAECDAFAISASLSLGPAVASCEPSGGKLDGEVVGLEPLTVCC